MAKQQLTGRPMESDVEDSIADLKAEYADTPEAARGTDFEDAYCLAKIRHQPEDYDGPRRHCVNRALKDPDHGFCRYHENYQNLYDYHGIGNLKHGATALRENVRRTFSEQEQAAYDKIVTEWPPYYDLDPHADMDDISSMAVEIIREVRVDAVLQDEGLKHLTTIPNEHGDDIEDESEHYLLSERRAIRNEINKIKRNLGINRDKRLKHEVEKDKASGISAFAERMNDAIDESGQEFDPDESFE